MAGKNVAAAEEENDVLPDLASITLQGGLIDVAAL